MEPKKENKYKCDNCRFECNYKSMWEKHINTELHKTGKKKKRSDYKEPDKCNKCKYSSKNKISMKQHILNEHATKDERKKDFKYYCEFCDYGTFSVDFINKHTETEKHKNFAELITNK